MKKLEERINKILAESVATPEEVEQIRKAEADKAAAEKELNEALKAGDTGAYLQAREAAIKAGAVIEMYKARARNRESGPLISAAEYEDLVTAIEEKAAASINKLKKEALRYCVRLQTLAMESAADAEAANKLLYTLQADIYKYADCETGRDGRPIVTSGREKHIKDYSLPAWVDYAINNCVQYDAMKAGISLSGEDDSKA